MRIIPLTEESIQRAKDQLKAVVITAIARFLGEDEWYTKRIEQIDSSLDQRLSMSPFSAEGLELRMTHVIQAENELIFLSKEMKERGLSRLPAYGLADAYLGRYGQMYECMIEELKEAA